MNVLITGASGFLGFPLVSLLHARGHSAIPLARGADSTPPCWYPAAGTIDLGAAPPPDAVVHLAGESVAGGRWTESRKASILSSRVQGTRLIAETVAAMTPKPKVLICASGINIYGDQGDTLLDESSPAGDGFLADVCTQWEQAADAARDAGIRVVHARISMVLAGKGGAMEKMLPPFRMGLGGRMGPGTQYYSWVTLNDAVRALYMLLENDALHGPVNIAAPGAVTNLEFTRTLGRALKRPTVFPMPAALARLALGQMADELLMSSLRVHPGALLAKGFEFEQATLEDAFASLQL